MSALITDTAVIAAVFTRDISVDKIEDYLILGAQQRHMLPILGDDLYDAVVLTPASYADLITALTPTLSYYVAHYMLPRLYNEIGTTGIYEFVSQQGKRRATAEDYQGLRDDMLEKAHMQAQVLSKWLDDNSDDYDLYNKGANPEEFIQEAGGILFRAVKREYPDDPYYPQD